jgi:hypothetical protein
LNEAEKRYAAARIEIQVASVLMHGWAEVEHDLVYKPLAGNLSPDEYHILDMVNGMVIQGEMALEQLQKAMEARVAASDRKIANHYELASLLLSVGEGITGEPISDSGLGRVDLLFNLIRALNLDTPESLKPYMEALHANLELRPLAEQITDAILAEDSDRYEIYDSIRAQRTWQSPRSGPEDEMNHHIGMFMRPWIELETLIRDHAPRREGRSPVIPTARQLLSMELLTEDTIYDFNQLRRMRNSLVHGVELPTLVELDEATRRLDIILADIKRRMRGPNESEQRIQRGKASIPLVQDSGRRAGRPGARARRHLRRARTRHPFPGVHPLAAGHPPGSRLGPAGEGGAHHRLNDLRPRATSARTCPGRWREDEPPPQGSCGGSGEFR